VEGLDSWNKRRDSTQSKSRNVGTLATLGSFAHIDRKKDLYHWGWLA
jgi:hypothetical protein